MTTDLFGDPITVETRRRKGVPAGHADVPGHGPPGETCGTCAQLAWSRRYSRTYYKCWLLKASWTHGYGTDVRLKDPACRLWAQRA